MITRKAGPALAAGCTVVIKPATQTSVLGAGACGTCRACRGSQGVLNVITGSAKEIGAELTSNPIVRKVSFTGSTGVGKVLMAQCSGTIKKLSLRVGRKCAVHCF